MVQEQVKCCRKLEEKHNISGGSRQHVGYVAKVESHFYAKGWREKHF